MQNEEFGHKAGYIHSIVGNFENEPYRLKISAVAGSGKSLFAYKFFNEKISEKKSVIYVCYNNSLAKKTRSLLGDYTFEKVNNEIRTFHDLCVTFLGVDPDEDGFNWNSLIRNMQEYIKTSKTPPAKWQFDSIIVDEGQDFETEWFEILKFFLKDKNKGEILWLEDSQQNLRGLEEVKLDKNFARWTCKYNFRTPQIIASYIKKNPKYDFEPKSNFLGKGVEEHYYSNQSEQRDLVLLLIESSLKEGFLEENITILTCYSYKSEKSLFSFLGGK